MAVWRERVGQIRDAAVVRRRPYRLVDATGDLNHYAQRIWEACRTPVHGVCHPNGVRPRPM